jgi:peptidoglycan/xylan/chitin deacetylase (PgdA/CDA1 family)
MYHYVRPIKRSQYPEIKGLEVDGFLKQLEFFKKNFHFITAEDLLDCVYNEKPIPEKSIWLTFDDGFKDHYTHVLPVLKKFHIQGSFFPPAKPIEENIVLDVHKIHFILTSVKNKQKIINEIFNLIKQFKNEYKLETPETYYQNLAISNRFDTKDVIFIKRILQRDLPKQAKELFTNQLFEKFVTKDEKSFSKELYLSFEEIHEMKELGMFFGSHGYAHEWLSYLSENNLDNEIQKSLNFIHKINSNFENLIMCYPYGDNDPVTISKLKNKGFKVGLTTNVGDAILDKSNSFSLQRYDTNDFPQ